MSLYKRPLSKAPAGITEFEILKYSHKFLRDEDERPTSWDDKLAAKYYASLYREFAVCDLKHYKSGNFALRWRTEDEVLSGAGEATCGNTRCERHKPPSSTSRLEPDAPSASKIPLTTLELPFAYMEQGESKTALVKVVVCGRCLKKLMWKRPKEQKESETSAVVGAMERGDRRDSARTETRREGTEDKERQRTEEKTTKRKRSRSEQEDPGREKPRRQRRSRSPRNQDRAHRSLNKGKAPRDHDYAS